MGFYRKITSLFDSQSKGTASFKDAERAMRLEQKQLDPGNFVFEEDRFIYYFKEDVINVRWVDIEKLIAYKANLITTDEICLDIIWIDGRITITEETPGWYQFNQRIEALFPGIPDNWYNLIVFPPFEKNETILFQKGEDI